MHMRAASARKAGQWEQLAGVYGPACRCLLLLLARSAGEG